MFFRSNIRTMEKAKEKAKALYSLKETMMLQLHYLMKLKKELHWLITNIWSSLQHILGSDSNIVIYAGLSTRGWDVADEKNLSRGRWIADKINRINVLELKAISLEVQTYCKGKNNENVSVISDNIRGGTKSEVCNKIAKELWVWFTSQNMWVSTAHFPGKQNTDADSFSRNFNEAIE